MSEVKAKSHVDIVTTAVYLCGGASEPIDTEDVGMKVNEIAPKRFSWRKYPSQINLELIRVALSDAKKPPAGILLEGDGSKGWNLTTAGMEWIRKQEAPEIERIQKPGTEDAQNRSLAMTRMKREKTRIMRTLAWQSWASEEDISFQDAKKVFRIDEYIKGRSMTLKINRMRDLFKDDPKLDPFLERLQSLLIKEENRNGQ